MSMNRSTILGLFFLITLSVLAYYTLFLTDFTLFKKQPTMRVQFEQANGLREGDAVLVAGMRWGRVKQLTFDPTVADKTKRVTVTAVLNDELQLREGFTVEIRDSTLLGGHQLAIDPGPAEGAPVSMDDVLSGTVAANPIDALREIVNTSGPKVTETIENFRVVSADLAAGKGTLGRLVRDQGMADDLALAVTSASKSLKNVEEITNDLRAGRGSAGQLLTNEELFDTVTAVSQRLLVVAEQMTGLIGDVRSGKGIVGRAIQDETIANDVASIASSASSIVKKIDSGQGTLGVFVNDETLARNLQAVSENLANGEGTIGALLNNPAVFENVRQITEDFAVFTGALRSGQGSIGRLVMDDDLYQDLKTAIRIVQRSLEEFREAAPITTFTTVFFGAF
jgi:phospholipid/cholesterol/gamma-HCH transport system substrate-binding protein